MAVAVRIRCRSWVVLIKSEERQKMAFVGGLRSWNRRRGEAEGVHMMKEINGGTIVPGERSLRWSCESEMVRLEEIVSR